jgi:hypothetical protein
VIYKENANFGLWFWMLGNPCAWCLAADKDHVLPQLTAGSREASRHIWERKEKGKTTPITNPFLGGNH